MIGLIFPPETINQTLLKYKTETFIGIKIMMKVRIMMIINKKEVLLPSNNLN